MIINTLVSIVTSAGTQVRHKSDLGRDTGEQQKLQKI